MDISKPVCQKLHKRWNSQRHSNIRRQSPLLIISDSVHSFHCSQGESSNNGIDFLVGMMWAWLAMGHHRRLRTSPPPRLHASRGRQQPESGIVAIVVELRQQCTTPPHGTNPTDLIHPLQNHQTTIVSSQSRTYSQTTIHRRNLPTYLILIRRR